MYHDLKILKLIFALYKSINYYYYYYYYDGDQLYVISYF